MDKKNEDSAEYFTDILTDKKDNFSNSLRSNFSLFLSVMTFKTLYHHILDTVKDDDNKQKFLEKLPDFIVDKWIENQTTQLNVEMEELKKQTSSTMMGQILGSMMGDPDKLKESYNSKIKIVGDSFRQMLNM